MDVTIDRSKCQNQAQCVYSAPEVFRLRDNGKVVYDAHPDESQRENVELAADVCPFQAITVSEPEDG